MLSEVKPSYEKAGALDLVLRRLHSLLSGLPSIAAQSLPSATEAMHKAFPSSSSVRIPFAEPAPSSSSSSSNTANSQLKFGFAAPSAVHLVGSWPLKAATKRPEGVDVDLALVMPSELFQEKDHMNLRYAHKRAFYLAVVASAIQQACSGSEAADKKGKGKGKAHDVGPKLSLQLQWELLDADPRRPVLVLSSLRDKSEMDFSKLKVQIRIHAAYDPATVPFNFGRLAPSRNGIRLNVASGEDKGDGEAALEATPIYNTTVLLDGLQLAHLVYLHQAASACPSFADACALLKTWSFQRGFGSGAGRRAKGDTASEDNRDMLVGSGSVRFVLTMLLAHLLKGDGSGRSKLSNGFSSYQLFRGVLDFLGKHDFATSPAFMKHVDGIPTHHAKIPSSDFAAHFERVLVDPTGAVNLFAFMPAGNVDALQHEARRTLQLLDDASGDHFDTIFLSDLSAALRNADELVQVAGGLSGGAPGPTSSKAQELLHSADVGQRQFAALFKMNKHLRQGLRERARAVSVAVPASVSTKSALDAAPASAQLASASFGLFYNIEAALRLVDHGPPPSDTAGAAAYRAFWGEVAELRRFKDGRVLESIVWKSVHATRRWSIPHQIVSYILQRHHGIGAGSVVFSGDLCAPLLDIDRRLAQSAYLSSPSEKGFQLVSAAYSEFTRTLRGIELPLSISSIAAASSALRGMSTFPPAPLNINALPRIPDVASYLPTQHLVITFESSARWPDELAAIQAMKAAFFERIATALQEKLPGTRTNIVFDEIAPLISDRCSLEVIVPTGFAFTASIHHDREKTLLERILNDKLSETPRRKRLARIALTTYERRFHFAPRHHTAMNTLTHKFAALPDAVRLAKRWIAAQMAASQVPEELTELLVASSFLALGDNAPQSGPAGFFAFLQRLATWRWREEPMLVPMFSASQAPEEVRHAHFPTALKNAALEAFQAARSADPALTQRAWYVATEQDVEGRWWGESEPFTGAADGLQQLARSAVAILSSRASLLALQSKVSRSELSNADVLAAALFCSHFFDPPGFVHSTDFALRLHSPSETGSASQVRRVAHLHGRSVGSVGRQASVPQHVCRRASLQRAGQ